MKTKEFNLSKFRVDDLRGGGQLGYREEDVKEFISELKFELKIEHKQDVKTTAEQGIRDINKLINQLAGDKLI